jgi:hypothetical protein
MPGAIARAAEPPFKKNFEPSPRRIIVHRAIRKMHVPRLGARHRQAVMPVRRPLVHHRVGDFGMKLQRKRALEPDRLDLENVAFGQKLAAARLSEAFAVPLIDAFRPGLDHGEAGRRRPHRVISNLGMAGRMAKTPWHQEIWRRSARRGRCREMVCSRAAARRPIRSRGGCNRRRHWRSSARRK